MPDRRVIEGSFTRDCAAAVATGTRAQRSLAQAILAFSAAVPSRRAWGWAVDKRGVVTGEMLVHSWGQQPRAEETAGRAYREQFWRDDPLSGQRFLDSRLRIATVEAAGGRREFGRSTYTREFFAPVGWADEIDLYLRDAGRMVATVRLLRAREDPPFQRRELAMLAHLHPLAELAYAAALEPPSPARRGATAPARARSRAARRERAHERGDRAGVDDQRGDRKAPPGDGLSQPRRALAHRAESPVVRPKPDFSRGSYLQSPPLTASCASVRGGETGSLSV